MASFSVRVEPPVRNYSEYIISLMEIFAAYSCAATMMQPMQPAAKKIKPVPVVIPLLLNHGKPDSAQKMIKNINETNDVLLKFPVVWPVNKILLCSGLEKIRSRPSLAHTQIE